MSHKHPDRLTRRVQKLEDRHRRDLVVLKREFISILAHHVHGEYEAIPPSKVNGGTYQPSAEY